MLRPFLVTAASLALFSLVAIAQAQPDKKDDAKVKADAKGKSKDAPKPKVPLDKLKLPGDSIIVVVDDWLEAAGIFPKLAVMKYEDWLEMREKLKALEQQLKAKQKTPFSCKLQGKLEDDFLICRVEFLFSTEQPKTVVPLGLAGAHLLGVGELDGRPPRLEVNEDGFSAKVDREGDHQLILNFRVPAQAKKSTTGVLERGVKLGLAETAITIVSLELPAFVKELRCNETLEKTKTPGRWLIGLEKNKNLLLAWKEPAAVSGSAAPKAETQIAVRVDEKDVNVSAKLYLQDARLQTKEWRIAAPPGAKVEVEAPPGGLTYELLPADAKGIVTLKTQEATAERWQVNVSWSVPRPNPGPRLPIGPLQALGAQQAGTITVTMPASVAFGQRLVFTRSDALRQLKNTETEAVFEYAQDKNGKLPPNMKAALEMEWRFEKNQAKTEVEHLLKLRPTQVGWEIDATTRIKVTALFSAVNAVDLKLPSPHPRGLSVVGTAAPGQMFPASLPWPGLWKALGPPWSLAEAEETTIFEEGNRNLLKTVPDASGKARVAWDRGPVKQMTLIVKNTYRVPRETDRLRLELPRPLNTQDRGARVVMQAEDGVEFVHGPPGSAEPVPDRDRFEQVFEQTPSLVEMAWRPFQSEIVAQAVVDIDLHEHSAQVRQALRFPRLSQASGSDLKNPLVEFVVPPGIDKVTASGGGQIVSFDRAKGKAWLRALGNDRDVDVILHYDLAVSNRRLSVTPIWPKKVSQQDVKVRIWAPPGAEVGLSAESLQPGVWKERGVEIVPEKKYLPSLVLIAHGANLALTVESAPIPSSSLAAFLAERALIAVQTGEDGGQQVQARYLVRKLNADYLDIELPIPLRSFRDRPQFILGAEPLTQYREIDTGGKVVRITLHPDLAKLPAILEISYAIPADGLERSFYRTTLRAPVFRSEVVIAQMRWQWHAATPLLVAIPGRGVRADLQWGLQGWLPTPEPSVTSGELDAWLTGKETGPGGAVTFAFWQVQAQPATVYHLPRQGWLLGSSGSILFVGLGIYLLPISRRWLWTALAGFAIALVVLVVLWPAAYAPVLFGMQPGLVLLAVFIGAHLLLQERYRRQLVFLPGFTRAKPTSTMVRASSAKQPREASTVDAPSSGPASAARSAGSPAGS